MIDWQKYPYLVRKRTTNYIHQFKGRECYNVKDIYKFFVELKRDTIPSGFLICDFKKIHQEYNKLLQEAMLEGEVIKPPYITGSIFIKRVRSIYRNGPYIIKNHKNNIENKAIIEENRRLGLTNPSNIKLRWGGVPKWMKPNFYGYKREYCFKPTDDFKKRLNKKLAEDSTYYTKLLDSLTKI